MSSLLAGLVLPLVLASAGATVHIPPSAGADECPANDALALELARLLPPERVSRGEHEGATELAARLDWNGRHWTLVLRLGEGAPAIVRYLDGGAAQCAEVATTAALIIDRALNELDWAGSNVSLAPPVPPAAPRRAPPPALRYATVSVGPALRVWESGPRLAGVVDVSARWADRWRFSVSGVIAQREEVPIEVNGRLRGALRAQPLSVWVSAGWCTESSHPLSACGGLLAGATGARAEASGSLPRTGSAWLLRPGAGVYGLVARHFGPVEFAAEIRGVAPFARPSAVVEGTGAEWRAPALDAGVVTRVGWRFF